MSSSCFNTKHEEDIELVLLLLKIDDDDDDDDELSLALFHRKLLNGHAHSQHPVH